jgi:hypothetical protein
MAKIITTVLPNFATFDVKNPIINPGQIIQSEQVYLLNTVMYGIVYSALLIVAAIFIFDRREV